MNARYCASLGVKSGDCAGFGMSAKLASTALARRGAQGRGGPPHSRRRAPTLWNSGFLRNLFWDGRAHSLVEQAQGPLFAADEMANSRERLERELNIFRGVTLGCSQCHTPPLFTNDELEVTGIPNAPGLPIQGPEESPLHANSSAHSGRQRCEISRARRLTCTPDSFPR